MNRAQLNKLHELVSWTKDDLEMLRDGTWRPDDASIAASLVVVQQSLDLIHADWERQGGEGEVTDRQYVSFIFGLAASAFLVVLAFALGGAL